MVAIQPTHFFEDFFSDLLYILDLNAAVFITFYVIRVRRVFEGGVY